MAADIKLITDETFALHPEWDSAGLKVGDPEPVIDTASPVEPAVLAGRGKSVKNETDTVTVDREMLNSILKEVTELRGKVEKVDQLEKDNAMLLEVADKSRVATYQARNNPSGLVRTARAWLWNGKLVKATVTIRNDVFTDTVGRIHTDQVLNVIMDDASEMEVPYDKFAKEKDFAEGEIIKKNTNEENGQTFYTLRFKDGKTADINYIFLN